MKRKKKGHGWLERRKRKGRVYIYWRWRDGKIKRSRYLGRLYQDNQTSTS